MEPVWETAARAPAGVRPAFTVTIGFLRVILRAISVNRRGLPKDSRYIRITRTSGSSSQYSSRSLPDTSVLFPMLTNIEMPRPSSLALARIASPSAPLWDRNAADPRSGLAAAKEAFNRTPGAVLITPMQLGPTILIPARRTSSRSLPSSAFPSLPASRKPAVITISPRPPLRLHSSTTRSTVCRGTTMTARSTSSGMSRTEE